MSSDLGPSGEKPNETPAPAPRLDPATKRPLPEEIGGFVLPPNFDSSRISTWPHGLNRSQVDGWLFSSLAGREDLEPPADLVPDAQPANEGPVDRNLQQHVITRTLVDERLARIERRLETIAEKIGAHTPHDV